MADFDFIIKPEWIIPVEPANTVLHEHFLGVKNGSIAAIAPCAELPAELSCPLLDRPGHALLPGFINAHGHAAMSLFRGMADDLPLNTWLQEHIWPAEGRWLSYEFVRDGTELAISEMLAGGTTTFADMYLFPDAAAAVAAERGIRASIGMVAIDAPTPWASNIDEYLAKGIQVHDQYREHPLVDTSFGPHSMYAVPDEAQAKIRTLANEMELQIQLHLHETSQECADSVAATGQRPLARLNDLDMVNSQLIAVHMTDLTDPEIELLAARGAHVAHCPESNLKLASGFCPVAKLLAAGVNVALGTDGAASNNDLDMLSEMRTAALLAKGVSGDAGAVSVDQALAMATINGARALGLESITGSLTSGKLADMITIDLSTAGSQPVYNPLSQIVFTATRDQVRDVWVGGDPRIADKQPGWSNESDILQRATEWQQRIAHDS